MAMQWLTSLYNQIIKPPSTDGAIGVADRIYKEVMTKVSTLPGQSLPYLKSLSSGVRPSWDTGSNRRRSYYDDGTSTEAVTPEMARASQDLKQGYSGSALNALYNVSEVEGRRVPVTFSGVNQDFNRNRNPELMGGMATVTINGQTLSIPNAAAQQLLFKTGVNQGRYDPGSAFGTQQIARGTAQGMSNVNYQAAQQQINRFMQQNPLLNQPGVALNPYEEAKRRYTRAQMGTEAATKALSGYTEQVNLFGQPANQLTQRKQSDYERALKEQEAARMGLGLFRSRGAKLRAARQAESLGRQAQKAIELFAKPTVSNLQIQERLIS